MDSNPDLPVPGISASQLALVEPDFDASCAECLANLLGRLRILRGGADRPSVQPVSAPLLLNDRYRESRPTAPGQSRSVHHQPRAEWRSGRFPEGHPATGQKRPY